MGKGKDQARVDAKAKRVRESGKTSVFKKGQKNDSVAAYDEATIKRLAAAYEGWQETWDCPRQGREISVAKWLPVASLAEVKLAKGGYMKAIGVMCRGKQYLTIEEVVFLVDRGSMLLVCDSEDGDERELSRQECYSLLTQLGVSPATFQVYSHLMRDGVTVRRFPPVWQQNTGTLAGLHAPWSTYWPDSATTVAKDLARSDPRPGPPRGSVSAPCEAAAPTDESPPEAPTAGGAAGSLPEQRPALPAAGAASVPPERLGLARDQEAGVQGHAAPSALAGAVEHDTGALRQTGAAACDPSSTLAANATDLDPGAGDMDAAGVSTSGAAPANTAMYHVRFAAMSDEAVFSRRQPPYVQYVVAVMNDTSECAPSWVDCATCEAAVHGSEHANADVLYAIADSGDVHFTQCPPGGVPDLLM